MSKESEAPLSLSDCRCNICMEIFVEPVTLPCHHTVCNSCFQLTVEKASLCCPFCRRRVSSWARYNARANTLINSELWEKIQKYFPEECQCRMNGQDLEEDACLPQPVRCLSKPGELRQEYEAEIMKVEAERWADEQEESKASEEYIQKLLAEEEEEQRASEERRKEMTEQLLQDEMLARELSFNLNSSSEEHILGSLSSGPSTSNSCKTSKNKSSNSGDIKKYLSPKSCSTFPPELLSRKLEDTTSFSGESSSINNSFTCGEEGKDDEMPTLSPQIISEARNTKGSILESSMPHLNICTTAEFNPLSLDLSQLSSYQVNEPSSVTHKDDSEMEHPFSKRGAPHYDSKNDSPTGNKLLTKHAKINALQKTLTSVITNNNWNRSIATCDQVKMMGNKLMENKSHSGSLITKEIPKRKSQESPLEAAVDFYMNDKRRRTFSQTDEDKEIIQKQMSLELQLYERYKQEEEDRRLALKLQKEMDKEQKTLNRKKGSPDEYHLRPKTSSDSTPTGGDSTCKILCSLSKDSVSSNSQTEIDQRKLRRGSHNENWKPYKLRKKSSNVKEGNVLNCVLNGSKGTELLPNKQKTIIQMFNRSSTK